MKLIKKTNIEIGKLSQYAQQVEVEKALNETIKIDPKYVQYVKVEGDLTHVIKADMHPFVKAVHQAYSDHLRLNITPDMIWYLIASGVATHINLNAEQLRYKFVYHEGKKQIKVRRDDFVYGAKNPWNEVIDEFCDKVGKNTKTDVADVMQANFSTTSKDAQVVSQIVLMDAMQQYFEYYCSTLCGIPEIRLHGDKQDWQKVREKKDTLIAIIPELSVWSKALDEILDHFLSAFDDKVDEKFWSEIYKVSGGSGGPFISGWILALFPYLDKQKKNRYVWESDWRMSKAGLHRLITKSFAYHMNQVPFTWNYFGNETKMLFVGGLFGVSFDEKESSLTPIFGYSICEDKVELDPRKQE